MGIVDTLAPVILASLLGLGFLAVVVGFVVFWLVPRAQAWKAEASQRRAYANYTDTTWNHSCTLLDDLLVECAKNAALSASIPDSLMGRILELHNELKGAPANASTPAVEAVRPRRIGRTRFDSGSGRLQ